MKDVFPADSPFMNGIVSEDLNTISRQQKEHLIKLELENEDLVV